MVTARFKKLWSENKEMKNFMQVKGFSLWNCFSPFSLGDYSSLLTFPKQSQLFACAAIQLPWNHDDKENKTEKDKTKNLKMESHHASPRLLEVLWGCSSVLVRWFWGTGSGIWKSLGTFPKEIMREPEPRKWGRAEMESPLSCLKQCA